MEVNREEGKYTSSVMHILMDIKHETLIFIQLTNMEINSSAMANQLDKHTVGYLTWKAGMQSGMNTMIIRDTPNLHLVFSAYIGIPHTYVALSYTHKMPDHEAKVKLTGK